MSRLRVFADDDAEKVHFTSEDHAAIAARLSTIGVRFERWPLRLAGDDALVTYADEIAGLVAAHGFQSIDAVSVSPEHPQREAMRAKFLEEHVHHEDEVRFFVAGAGTFTLHVGAEVFEIRCEAGDLIGVPDGTKHWFDMGPAPSFTAIRFFRRPDGWVGHFTGSDIAGRFPRHA
jgi:1,2-dihydroxy-3-keto-5-methylthiopentene dioxygenase